MPRGPKRLWLGRRSPVRAASVSVVLASIWLLTGPATPAMPMALHGTPMAARGSFGVTVGVFHAPRASLDDLSRQLMCTCGCNLTVAACQVSMTCQVAGKMKDEAAAMITRGMTTKEILAAFSVDYGERVLAQPAKRGFNLMAWVLPFAALAFGAAVLVLALRRWHVRPQVAATSGPAVPVDADYLAEIEEEIKRGM